jgi:tetratricopeptide (TPR) repeat protein
MLQTARLTASERSAYEQGRKCFEHGDVEPALDAFAKLLQTRESFADVHYMVGLLHDSQGDLGDACESLRRALRINPDYAEALLALATIYERRGDFDRSCELADRAMLASQRGARGDALDSTTRGKLANLQAAVGDAYVEVGELREGIEAYRKALDHCPDFHDIRYRLGRGLREGGLPDQAMAEFQRVLRARPGFLDAQTQLGLTYYTLGRANDAMNEWRAVLERDPAHRDARMYLRLVEAATRPAAADSDTG